MDSQKPQHGAIEYASHGRSTHHNHRGFFRPGYLH